MNISQKVKKWLKYVLWVLIALGLAWIITWILGKLQGLLSIARYTMPDGTVTKTATYSNGQPIILTTHLYLPNWLFQHNGISAVIDGKMMPENAWPSDASLDYVFNATAGDASVAGATGTHTVLTVVSGKVLFLFPIGIASNTTSLTVS